MPSLHITVNGETWMNGDLGEWQQKQPEQFVQALKNPRAAQPGTMALLTAISECVTSDKAYSLELTTSDNGEFTLTKKKGTTQPWSDPEHDIAADLAQAARDAKARP